MHKNEQLKYLNRLYNSKNIQHFEYNDYSWIIFEKWTSTGKSAHSIFSFTKRNLMEHISVSWHEIAVIPCVSLIIAIVN